MNKQQKCEVVSSYIAYKHEKELYSLIKNGRVDEIEDVLKKIPESVIEILETNELRYVKNIFIKSITMFTYSAIEGGVEEVAAYEMGDKYIYNGERCNTVKELKELYKKAISEFTQHVSEVEMKCYSKVTQSAIYYVHRHIHEKITLQKTANSIGVSDCYLSRIFRQETGISFVDYIQKEKIKLAKKILICSKNKGIEISEYLSFSSKSYYIKIFKKYTGMTPTMYQRYYMEQK
ncbi:MAG: AraC family transcriptional regulator [Candidatus Ruminococcus intestinipullorum]|nr:AraC family transcriptional regulator [Candidatus Ruminococcus intestinipullorum]